MSRHYDFMITQNNYTDEEYDAVLKLLSEGIQSDKIRYYAIGKEVGKKCGTPHFHLYIYYKNARTFSALKKQYPKANIGARYETSTFAQAADYAKKDGNYVEDGKLPCTSSVNLWDSVKKDITEGIAWRDLCEKYPEYAIKYAGGLRSYFNELSPKFQYELPQDRRPFQKQLLELADEEPNDRQVLWIFDKVGNSGKTKLAMHLASQKGFLNLENGKTADIAHAWNGENVIFDFSRTQESHINYQVIESIKNGKVFSGKYNSVSKAYPSPHVWIFANFLPDYAALSKDRWVVMKMRSDYEIEIFN